MALLAISHISKSFGQGEVLRDVSLTVEKGDVISILGKSGSGKTTLLRCINFLERADAGTMVFDGQKVDLHRAAKKEIDGIRRETGFVFQNYNLFRNLNVLENVTLGLTAGRRMDRKAAEQKALDMLSRVGMEEERDKFPSQLSGGQQQRVAIARALHDDAGCNPRDGFCPGGLQPGRLHGRGTRGGGGGAEIFLRKSKGSKNPLLPAPGREHQDLIEFRRHTNSEEV